MWLGHLSVIDARVTYSELPDVFLLLQRFSQTLRRLHLFAVDTMTKSNIESPYHSFAAPVDLLVLAHLTLTRFTPSQFTKVLEDLAQPSSVAPLVQLGIQRQSFRLKQESSE